MSESTKSIALRYGSAILVTVAAAILRLIFLEPLGTRVTYVTFYLAVTIAALFGGVGPGILATLLSALTADFFLIEPVGEFTISNFGDRLGMSIFVFSGTGISLVCEKLRRTAARASQAEAKLNLAAGRLQAEEELATDLAAMTRLQHIGSRLVSSKLADVLGEVVEAAIAVTHADMGNIQLVDPQTDCLKIAAFRGFKQPFLDFWNAVTEGHGACGTAKANARRVLVEDVTKSSIFVGTPALEVQLTAGVRAVQSTPLIGHAGTLIGMLSTHWHVPHVPRQHELYLLDLLVLEVVNIIERERQEQTLRESEDRLNRAQRIAHLGSWDFNLVTNRLSWSDETYQIFGLKPQEFGATREAFLEAVHPDDRSAVDAAYSGSVREGHDSYEIEHRIVRKDTGEIRVVHEKCSHIRDTSGRVIRSAGMVHDITERKQAEEALREISDRAAWLARFPDENPDPLLRVAADGTILYCNQSAAMSPGWECEAGATLPQLILPMISQAMSLGQQSGQDLEMSGRVYAVWVVPVVAEKYANVYGRDVTDLKKAEEERARFEAEMQKMQKLESIGVLAGGIAHDFNNLLGGLFGYLEMAREYAEKGAIARIGPTLSKAGGAIDRARDLTRQLITFAKGGAPIKEVAKIEPLLRDIATLALSGSNIEFEWDIQRDLWPCSIDKNQMAQALDNILVNAKEAMPQGGRVFIKASNITSETKLPKEILPGKYVLISIKDEGPGISKEQLKRIFDPFFSTKETGHGLGLSIVHSVIKRHEGSIQVDSDGQHGTTFHIYLPATSQLPAAEKLPADEKRKLEGSILIMDDEEMMLDTASEALSFMGYNSTTARNGEAAIELYRKAMDASQPFDLVLLDLTVRGGMGGKETIKKLLEIDSSVCGVVISGYHDDPAIADPQAFGFKASIVKPFRPSELGAVIRKALEGKFAGPERAANE